MRIILILITLLTACSTKRTQLYTPDPEGIRQRIIEELPELQKCATDFAIANKVESKLSFVIQPDGSTTDHKIVEASASVKDLEACVLKKAALIRFLPTPDGNTITVKQAFNIWRKQ